MGFIRGLMLFLLNIAIFVIALRFVSMLLERAGVFRFLDRLFGKRDNRVFYDENVDIIITDANPESNPESDNENGEEPE
jgi:hypothetical protein